MMRAGAFRYGWTEGSKGKTSVVLVVWFHLIRWSSVEVKIGSGHFRNRSDGFKTFGEDGGVEVELMMKCGVCLHSSGGGW